MATMKITDEKVAKLLKKAEEIVKEEHPVLVAKYRTRDSNTVQYISIANDPKTYAPTVALLDDEIIAIRDAK